MFTVHRCRPEGSGSDSEVPKTPKLHETSPRGWRHHTSHRGFQHFQGFSSQRLGMSCFSVRKVRITEESPASNMIFDVPCPFRVVEVIG